MADPTSDLLQAFLTSYIGIIFQVVAIIAALIPGIKYINKKLDNRIDENVRKTLDPLLADICKQLTNVSNAMDTFQAETTTAIKYINKAINGHRTDARDQEDRDSEERRTRPMRQQYDPDSKKGGIHDYHEPNEKNEGR